MMPSNKVKNASPISRMQDMDDYDVVPCSELRGIWMVRATEQSHTVCPHCH